MFVVLDTNVFCQDYHMSGSSFHIFLNGLGTVPARLKIPEVVIDEVVNRYAEDMSELLQSSEKSIDRLNQLAGRKVIIPILLQTDVEKSKYKKFLVERIKSIGGEIIPYPNIPHKEVVARDLARKKPFNSKGAGYRDFLIWESIRNLMCAGDTTAVFVTNNTADFCANTELDPELKKEIVPGKSLFHSLHLKDFNEKYISPQLKLLEGLRNILQENRLPDFDVQIWIKNDLRKLIADIDDWGFILLGWPDNVGHVSPAGVEQYAKISIDSVRELPSKEKTLQISVDAKIPFSISVDAEECSRYEIVRNSAPMDDESLWVSWDVTENIKFTISVILNAESNAAVSQEIAAIEGPGGVVEF